MAKETNTRNILPGLDSYPGVIHMTPNVCQNLGSQAQLAYGLAVQTRLLGRSRRSEFDVIDNERIKGLDDSNLGLCIKERICKLLAL